MYTSINKELTLVKIASALGLGFASDAVNRLNAKLNPICHLLALLGAHHILHVSRMVVK